MLSKTVARIRKRIEKGFCKNTLSKDKNSRVVDVFDRRAVKFCLYGVCLKEKIHPVEADVLGDIIFEKTGLNMLNFNDTNSKATVVKLLKEIEHDLKAAEERSKTEMD